MTAGEAVLVGFCCNSTEAVCEMLLGVSAEVTAEVSVGVAVGVAVGVTVVVAAWVDVCLDSTVAVCGMLVGVLLVENKLVFDECLTTLGL